MAATAFADVRERHCPYPEWQALFTHRSTPQYPLEARRSHLTGDGRYRLYVDHSGAVTDVKVLQSTSHSLLDAAAVNALKSWHAIAGRRREIDISISFMMSSNRFAPPKHRVPDVIVREFRE